MKKFLFTGILSLIIGYGTAQTPIIWHSFMGNDSCVSSSTSAILQLDNQSPSSSTIAQTDWTIKDPSGNIIFDQTIVPPTPHPMVPLGNPGVYTVIMCVTWTGGQPKCDSVKVTVFPSPQFSFTKNADSICPGAGIGFSYSLDPPFNQGMIKNILWDFGDGGTSNQVSPTWGYSNGGNIVDISYNVSLTLTDTNGCIGSTELKNYVLIHAKPDVKFAVDTNSSTYFCFGEDTPNPSGTPVFRNYTDTLAGRGGINSNSYTWDFGDGDTDSGVDNVSHTYAPGTYHVTLYATNQYGCVDSLTIPGYIRVRQLLANYTVSKTVVCQLPDTIEVRGGDPSATYRWQISPAILPKRESYSRVDEFYFRNTPGNEPTGIHYLEVTMTDNTPGGASCSVVDTTVLYIYDNIVPEIVAADTNECDPDHVITFKDATKYPPEDFGAGEIFWDFGDGTTAGPADSVTHVYGTSAVPNGGVPDGGYGDYIVRMYGTTPYGCPIEAIYQGVHIFKMRATATIVVPGPPDPPHGCAPHTVVLANIPDSLVSSSPITSFVWRWNMPGYLNPVGDPDDNDTIWTGSTGDKEGMTAHTYIDTGHYTVKLTLTNEQGCVHDIDVIMIMVGHPPLTNFRVIKDTNCKPDIQIKVFAYDVVDENGNPLPTDTDANGNPAGAWANEWAWLDDQGNPIGTPPDSVSTISPNETGSAVVTLVSSHNGCPTTLTIRKEDLGYICPPVAAIGNPKDPMPNVHPLYCDLPEFTTLSDNGPFMPDPDGTKGAIYMKWFAGDSYPGDQNDTASQSQSGLIILDAIAGYYVSIDTSVYSDGSWDFGYWDGPYLDQLKGYITLHLWTMNDGSVLQDLSTTQDSSKVCLRDTIMAIDTVARYLPNGTLIPPGPGYVIISDTTYAVMGLVCAHDTVVVGYNPLYPDFYNPCIGRQGGPTGTITECTHFVDQVILISRAKMNFTIAPDPVCQGDSVRFYDSSTCSVDIFGWGFKIDSAANMSSSYLEPWMTNGYIPLGSWYPISNYTPWPSYGQGQLVTFTRPNIYRAVLQDTGALTSGPLMCIYNDTIRFEIHPQSIPNYLSSLDGINYTPYRLNKTDTICINAGGQLYIQDTSRSPAPYENANLTGWTWRLGSVTSTDENPVITQTTAGLYSLFLTLKNEFGCDTTHEFIYSVLANNIVPSYYTTKKEFCNKEVIAFYNQTAVNPRGQNANTFLKIVYDWGDGTTDTTYMYSGQLPEPARTHYYDLPNLENTVIVKMKATMLNNATDRLSTGCEEEFIDSIIIRRPKANFTDDGHEFPCPDGGGGQGRNINFSNTSDGSVDLLVWTFGDGSNPVMGRIGEEFARNPMHNYKNAGKYDVLLVVTDSNGCSDSLFLKEYVNILGARGSFSYEGNGKCAPLSVDFKPAVDPDINYRADSLTIITSDGGSLTSIGDSVSQSKLRNYLYRKAGAYVPLYVLYKSVVLNGKEELCMVQIKETDTIYVIDLKPDFETEPLYCPDIDITFNNISTWIPDYLDIDSLVWDFGNGATSEEYTDTTQYDPGTYPVRLTMKIMNCTQSKKVDIEVMQIPDVYITPDTAEACDGLDVVFLADSLIDETRISRYEWVFEDGETFEGNPITREFGISGEYPYTLKLTFTPANCFKDYPDTVTVFAYASPVASFEAKPEIGEVDEMFTFTDNSTLGDGKLVRWFWDYGDGETSPDSLKSTVEHAYTTTSGLTLVTLYIKDEHGCISKTDLQILITEKLGFPNVFTPRGNCPPTDNKPTTKCEFRPLEDKGYFKEFKLEIYDRWGMLVWNKHCTDPNCPDYQTDGFWWDGTNKQGKPVADGVYYWVVYATPLSETAPFIKNGSVTVVGNK